GMDEWRVNSNLKLTLGLRFDRNSNAVCYQNCFSRMPTAFPDINHDVTVPFNQLFVNGLSHAFPDIQPVSVQPRLGFAWTPNTKFQTRATTVLGGGVGFLRALSPETLLARYMRTALPRRKYTTSAPPPLSTAEPANAYESERVCDGIFTGVVAAGGTRAD